MLSTLLKPIGVKGRSSNTGRQPFVPLHRAVALCGWLQASLLGLGAANPLIPHNNPENRIHWIIPPKKFSIKYP